MQETEIKAELRAVEQIHPPAQYTSMQLSELAEQIKADLHSPDIQQRRATLRGIVSRIIARRTDDEILGVVQCVPLNYKVNATVPPRGYSSLTLLIPIRKRKAPIQL